MASEVVDDHIQTLSFRGLGFKTVPVARYSSRGTPFVVQEPVGMPKIAGKNLDVVCYLYASEDDAKAGKNFGGTGFLVSVKSEVHPTVNYLYAVTNWHVACKGDSVIRLNTKDGSIDVIPYGPDQWVFDPRYDIAVAPLPYNQDLHQVCFVPTDQFATKELFGDDPDKLGCGEDVFMIGRFVDHDGGLVNRPAVRFGNISVMPTPIKQPNERMADAFCIDLHSRSGYSGSPVFAYRLPGSDLTDIADKDEKKRKLLLTGANYLGLLGIHFAQFPEEWEIVSGKKKPKQESSDLLITEGKYVKGLSGMTCVLPAWTILGVLNLPTFKTQRAAGDAMWAIKYKQTGTQPPEPESKPKNDDNPNHRADFTALLDAAARKPKSDAQTS